MRTSGPVRGPSGKWLRAFSSGVLFLVFCVNSVHGQDVAAAARQQRERKTAQQKAPQHVYTDQDLKRQKILSPEDQARVEARKKQQYRDKAPVEQNAELLPADANSPTESLGEVARGHRREKAARAAEQAEKNKFTPFPYKIPDSSLAVAISGATPRVGSSPGLNISEPSVLSDLSPAHPVQPRAGARGRISPFQPRPFAVAPSAPLVAPTTPPRVPTAVHSAPAIPLRSPEAAGLQRIQVQRGQSWWKLSERYLGSGALWPELRKLNPDAVGPEESLRQGSTVLVPGKEMVRADSPRQQITVSKGDSLWSLSRQHLGRGSAWKCLAHANPQLLDYTRMSIGAPLQLPTSEALESCRSERSDKLQR
ncbi:MAG: LysM peptidoglycan-binding domain-containing protein [Candidatus Acidiferrum sp.]